MSQSEEPDCRFQRLSEIWCHARIAHIDKLETWEETGNWKRNIGVNRNTVFAHKKPSVNFLNRTANSDVNFKRYDRKIVNQPTYVDMQSGTHNWNHSDNSVNIDFNKNPLWQIFHSPKRLICAVSNRVAIWNFQDPNVPHPLKYRTSVSYTYKIESEKRLTNRVHLC